jgi:hypothetical protein
MIEWKLELQLHRNITLVHLAHTTIHLPLRVLEHLRVGWLKWLHIHDHLSAQTATIHYLLSPHFPHFSSLQEMRDHPTCGSASPSG